MDLARGQPQLPFYIRRKLRSAPTPRKWVCRSLFGKTVAANKVVMKTPRVQRAAYVAQGQINHTSENTLEEGTYVPSLSL